MIDRPRVVVLASARRRSVGNANAALCSAWIPRSRAQRHEQARNQSASHGIMLCDADGGRLATTLRP